MAKLKIKFTTGKDQLFVEILEQVGLSNGTDDNIYVQIGKTWVYSDGMLIIGTETTTDSCTTHRAVELRDQIVQYISEELFNGRQPSVDGEDYVWSD